MGCSRHFFYIWLMAVEWRAKYEELLSLLVRYSRYGEDDDNLFAPTRSGLRLNHLSLPLLIFTRLIQEVD
jgi:hypothetical protein